MKFLRQSGRIHPMYVILLCAFFISAYLALGSPMPEKGTDTAIVIERQQEAGRSSIQINTLITATPTPLPPPSGPLCGAHQNVPDCSKCCPPQVCFLQGNGYHCDAKPVIYLYPPKPTFVDVSVDVPGKIVVSDPLYPEGGWKRVFAYPNGLITYKEKNYSELFYEALIAKTNPPKTGVITETGKLKPTLDFIVTQLGLTSSEKQELLNFWVPRLTQLNSPYIHVSLYSQMEKDTFDRVRISPTPDVFIQFILYFKPVSEKKVLETLELPRTPPQRRGFTAVEWGGIIDQ